MKLKNKIEALLFASGDKMSIEELSRLLEVKELEIEEAIDELIGDYANHSISLMRFDNFLQLATKPEYYDIINQLSEIKFPKLLTDPQLEALSVIAYRQPCTKLDIESLRGVKSDKVIKTLLEKKLIEESGKSERTGGHTLYKTTEEFLKTFGFRSLDDLPELGFVRDDELKTILE